MGLTRSPSSARAGSRRADSRATTSTGDQYRGTGADTGNLTLTVDILPIPQVSDLTFDSRTTGTFAAGAGGVVLCEGGFELVDSTIPDTTPSSLVGAEVAVSGDEMVLAFDEEFAGVDSLLGLGALRHGGRGTGPRRWVRLRGLRAYRPSPAALPVRRHHPGSVSRSLLRRSHPRRRRCTPGSGRQRPAFLHGHGDQRLRRGARTRSAVDRRRPARSAADSPGGRRRSSG